jgi:hypothetical protein
MKVQIGDLVEVKTKKGFAYALYTHSHDKRPRFGAMLRLFDELYPSRPANLNAIVSGRVRLSIFFPLQAAVDRGLVEVIGRVSIPKSLQTFPIFRTGMVNPQTKKVDSWWLWDGEHEWRIGELTPEQRTLPIRGVWNDTILIQRIEEGWSPDNDPTTK